MPVSITSTALSPTTKPTFGTSLGGLGSRRRPRRPPPARRARPAGRPRGRSPGLHTRGARSGRRDLTPPARRGRGRARSAGRRRTAQSGGSRRRNLPRLVGSPRSRHIARRRTDHIDDPEAADRQTERLLSALLTGLSHESAPPQGWPLSARSRQNGEIRPHKPHPDAAEPSDQRGFSGWRASRQRQRRSPQSPSQAARTRMEPLVTRTLRVRRARRRSTGGTSRETGCRSSRTRLLRKGSV